MPTLNHILQNYSKEKILRLYETALNKSNEEDFWKKKILPFLDATLDTFIQLREQNLLFTPEGHIVAKIDKEFLYRWLDLVCLRTLIFILNESNEKEKLVSTDYENISYKNVNFDLLKEYLFSCDIDFPVAIYNLHTGISSVIKSLEKYL